jgi:hypothetical protein
VTKDDCQYSLAENFDGVVLYQKFGERCRGLSKATRLVEYLVKRAGILYEFRNDNLNAMRKIASAMAQIKCETCGKKTELSITVEAKTKGLPIALPVESALDKEEIEDFFLVKEGDTPRNYAALAEAKRMLIPLAERNLSFSGHKDLVRRIHWEPKEPEKPEQSAEKFVGRVNALQKDIAKVGEMLKGEEPEEVKFATEEARMTLSRIAIQRRSSLSNSLLRALRRSLAENLLWLGSEVDRIVNVKESPYMLYSKP